MNLPSTCLRLRIYLGESDQHEHRPLYEVIVLRAREVGLAGATVTRGALGFGASSRLHTAKILRLSLDLPLVIEIVDAPEKIAAFVPEVQKLLGGGLITTEPVQVLHYQNGGAAPATP